MTSREIASDTWTAKIYCGLVEGYAGKEHSIVEAESLCQEYCDEIGWCVTVTPTKFIYKNGSEPGFVVGIIQYPRFPTNVIVLRGRALELADRLRIRLNQIRLTVELPDKTIMLSGEEPE